MCFISLVCFRTLRKRLRRGLSGFRSFGKSFCLEPVPRALAEAASAVVERVEQALAEAVEMPSAVAVRAGAAFAVEQVGNSAKEWRVFSLHNQGTAV